MAYYRNAFIVIDAINGNEKAWLCFMRWSISAGNQEWSNLLSTIVEHAWFGDFTAADGTRAIQRCLARIRHLHKRTMNQMQHDMLMEWGKLCLSKLSELTSDQTDYNAPNDVKVTAADKVYHQQRTIEELIRRNATRAAILDSTIGGFGNMTIGDALTHIIADIRQQDAEYVPEEENTDTDDE